MKRFRTFFQITLIALARQTLPHQIQTIPWKLQWLRFATKSLRLSKIMSVEAPVWCSHEFPVSLANFTVSSTCHANLSRLLSWKEPTESEWEQIIGFVAQHKISWVYFRYCGITNIPNSFSTLVTLKRLDLFGSSPIKPLFTLQAIQSGFMNQFALSSIFAFWQWHVWFALFIALTFSATRTSILPDSIGNLVNLKNLTLNCLKTAI